MHSDDEGVNLDADGAPCPQGDECAVHHRNDEEVIDDDSQFGRMITYVGEYVVVTTDNPELESPVTILKMVLGQLTPDTLPPLYETCVVHVGTEGVLADVRKFSSEERREAIRFIQKHDSWENFQEAHKAILEGVERNFLDLSKSAYSQE